MTDARENDKHGEGKSEFFSKLLVSAGVLVGGYFLIRWVMGDISTKPLAQYTLKDIFAIIFSFGIAWILLKSIGSVLDK